MPTSAGRFILPMALLLCCAADAQLVEGSRKGDVDAVKRLLEQGIDVNRRENNLTPLIAAARHGHVDIMRLLLSAGADPNLAVSGRYIDDRVALEWFPSDATPLEIAAYFCQDSAFALLAEQDATMHSESRVARRKRTLFEISGQLCSVEGRHGSADSRVNLLAADLRQDLWYLFDRWPAGFEGAAAYMKELEAIGGALGKIAQMNETERALAILQDVAQDLAVKAADCRLHDAARVAPVAVHTVREGEPSPGWQLFYLSKFMAHFPDVEFELFPNLSSPARHSMPPGRYVVTAKMPGSEKLSKPQTITVGGESAQEEWQIPVP